MYPIKSKKKRLKKALSMLLMLILVIGLSLGTMDVAQAGVPEDKEFPPQSNSHLAGTTYLAMGDSIAFGLSADPGEDYVNLLTDELTTTKKHANVTLYSIAELGETSGSLLNKLCDEGYRDAIKELDPDIITISVGGNDILGQIYMYLAVNYSIYPAYNTWPPAFPEGLKGEIYNDPLFLQKLYLAIEADPDPLTSLYFMLGDPYLMPDDNPATTSMVEMAASGFIENWSEITKEIHRIAPDAEVYVMTLYNPLPVPGTLPIPDYDVAYAGFNGVIQSMNMAVKGSVYSYRLADVYTAFNENPGSVNFLLPVYDGAILITPISLDPHPTTLGHEVIFEQHVDARIARALK